MRWFNSCASFALGNYIYMYFTRLHEYSLNCNTFGTLSLRPKTLRTLCKQDNSLIAVTVNGIPHLLSPIPLSDFGWQASLCLVIITALLNASAPFIDS